MPQADEHYFFTSESVSMGHPDKVADQISDAVLDTLLEHDPMARVACETFVTTGLVMVGGEITVHNTKAQLALGNVEDVVRETIRKHRLRTVDDVREHLPATKGCGTCRPDVEDLLAEDA